MTDRRKHGGGRPPVPLDLRQVEELARIGCTEADMAAVLGVSVDTIQDRRRTSDEFRGAVDKGQASLRNALRRLQVKKALEGNVTMLIWLGKQLLGQSDRQGIEHSGAEGRPPIQIIEVVKSYGRQIEDASEDPALTDTAPQDAAPDEPLPG
jgi:hypothetical protein